MRRGRVALEQPLGQPRARECAETGDREAPASQIWLSPGAHVGQYAAGSWPISSDATVPSSSAIRAFASTRPRGQHPERPERLAAIDRALDPLADRVRRARPARGHSRRAAARARPRVPRRAGAGSRAAAASSTPTRTRRRAASRWRGSPPARWSRRRCASPRGEAKRAFAALRPPGHHAERARADGLLPVQQRRRRGAGAARGGAGSSGSRSSTGTCTTATARSTCSRPSATCCSSRCTSSRSTRAPARSTSRGSGAGLGSTVNFPLPAGCGDAEYGQLFDELRGADAARVPARDPARVRRLRRARARPARRHAACRRAGFAGVRRASCARWPTRSRAAGSCSRSRAATTSTRWASRSPRCVDVLARPSSRRTNSPLRPRVGWRWQKNLRAAHAPTGPSLRHSSAPRVTRPLDLERGHGRVPLDAVGAAALRPVASAHAAIFLAFWG